MSFHVRHNLMIFEFKNRNFLMWVLQDNYLPYRLSCEKKAHNVHFRRPTKHNTTTWRTLTLRWVLHFSGYESAKKQDSLVFTEKTVSTVVEKANIWITLSDEPVASIAQKFLSAVRSRKTASVFSELVYHASLTVTRNIRLKKRIKTAKHERHWRGDEIVCVRVFVFGQ